MLPSVPVRLDLLARLAAMSAPLLVVLLAVAMESVPSTRRMAPLNASVTRTMQVPLVARGVQRTRMAPFAMATGRVPSRITKLCVPVMLGSLARTVSLVYVPLPTLCLIQKHLAACASLATPVVARVVQRLQLLQTSSRSLSCKEVEYSL